MKIFVINSGSSSLKFQLIDMPQGTVMAEWNAERIGIEGWFCTVKANGKKLKKEYEIKNHKDALGIVLESLLTGETKVMESVQDIKAVWHRVVHGWEKFHNSVVVTPEVLEYIWQCSQLAPLHNPAHIQWIKAIQEILPQVQQVVVFDTAFHQTMKPENYMYALPYRYYEKYKIRRYGFHGTSHKYVSNKACELLGKNINETRIINCHIGNGSSICAIQKGNVVETSMWFTPLEWLIMWSRSWDLDPAILGFIAKKEGKTFEEIDTLLNKQSWILWISEKYTDLREIEDGYLAWDERCTLAMNMYINRIVKYIWAYTALMGWVDIISLTAWVLENSAVMRKILVNRLWFLNIQLDEAMNDFRGQERVISKEGSSVVVIVVPTNEELVIATDSYKLVTEG